MASVQFKRGLLADIPEGLVDGTIYITTDEGGMYVDTATKRVRLGDFIPVNTISDLPAAGHAYETAVYYVKQGNILARWDATNSRWIQINKAGVVAVTNDANNAQGANVVSNISITTNANGELSLVLTKATVATSEDLSALAATVANHTSDLNVLNGGVNTNGSVAKQVADAKAALLGNPTTYTTIEALETALAAVKTTADAADTRSQTNATNIGNLQSDLTALTTRVGTAESAITTLNGDANTTGSVANKVKAEADARAAADTALGTRIDGINTRLTAAETDIDNLQSDVSTIQNTLGSGDNSLTSRVAANETAIATLNGSGDGSVSKQVADAVAGIVNGAPAAYDTLKEISDWIGNNPNGASAMNTAIQNNASDISALQGRMTTAEGDIDALESELNTANTGLKARMTAAENAITTLNADNTTAGSVDYKIKQAVDTINSSIADANSDITALDGRLDTAEANITTIMGTGAGSITAAVKAEEDRAKAAEGALGTRLTTAETNITNALSDITTINGLLTWKEF